jgi:uncharacterized LabA/DUF88 family protein
VGRLKCALLIDFDNIHGALVTLDEANRAKFVDQITNWMAWFEDGAFAEKQRQRRFIERRIYWNTPFRHYAPRFEAAGFKTFTCTALAKHKIDAGKSSADIIMTMDAMEIARDNKGLQEIILLTADTDFVPVVNRLSAGKLRIVTAGNERNPSYALFQKYAGGVIHLGALHAAIDYQRTPRKWYQLRAPAPAVAPIVQEAGRNSPLLGRMLGDLQSVKTAARIAKIEAENAAEGHAPEASARDTARKPVNIAGQREAARLIEQLGKPIPDQAMLKENIIQILRGIDGFFFTHQADADPWFGCRNFAGLMRKVAKINPNIAVLARREGGIDVVYRVAAPAPAT